MMTATVALTPLIESDCPACLHRAARPARRYRLIRLSPPEEAHPLTRAMREWFALRCRCGHAWVTTLVVGVEVREEAEGADPV